MKLEPFIAMIVLYGVLPGALGAAPPTSQTSLAAPAGAIRYVKSGASGDCSTWANACALQTALSVAGDGDEIWVKEGQDVPTEGIPYGSCQEIHDAIPEAPDGDYVIRHEGDAFLVYCADMAGAPAEYLTLADPANNFAQYTAGGYSEGDDVRTEYEKVRLRLEPGALQIDISDQRFANSTGSLMHVGTTEVHSVSYGVAMDCRAPFSRQGVARIDLRGTPFMVDDPFMKCGFESAGSWRFSAGNQVVDLTGGGECGSVQPESQDCMAYPFNDAGGPQPILELGYLHGSCQDIHDAIPEAPDGDYVIRHEGNAFQVYCADMAGGVPAEYLTLDPANNYAQYTAGGYSQGDDVRTEYEKVRLRLLPGALQIDISDQRFANSTGSLRHGAPGGPEVKSVSYGVAMDCREPKSQTGIARIDLRGTPFVVNDTFMKCGWESAGSWTFSPGKQVVYLTGGGACGWVQPSQDCMDDPFNGAGGPQPILELGYSPAGEEDLTVPWVKEQFNSLQLHGDPMAFHRGDGDDPSLYRHYQGMARVNGPDGTPYIILTRSNNTTWAEPCTTCPNGPGELLVVQMGSRGKDGERLRSNLLNPSLAMEDTSPPESDKGVHHIHFNGQDGWPPYSHLGGVQLVGDVLVVPLEEYCSTSYTDGNGGCATATEKRGGIALIDVSSPEDPSLIYYEDFSMSGGWAADTGLGVAGVIYVRPGEHPTHGGRYLFILTWGESWAVRFAWSDTDDLKTTKDLVLEPYTWNELDLPGDKAKWRDWQMLNFVRDTYDDLGPLFLIGADKDGGEDWVGLFKVDVSKLKPDSYQQSISYVAEKHLYLNDPDMGSLDAASGVYVSPTGQMILYTGPHDNDRFDGTVEMGEFRNINVYQGDTKARQTMCPWIELYEDDPGWDDDSPDRSLMLDFQDRKLESWWDLRLEDFNDEADSLRWYLKPGQGAFLYEDTHWGGDAVRLIANGSVGWGSLDEGDWDFGDETSSVKMGPFADPGGPYTGYEGRPIPLDAANLCYTDPNDASVIFFWGVDSPACTLSDASARQPSLICDASGSYIVTLTVTDWVPADRNYSATNSTTVTVENVQRIYVPVLTRS